MRRASLRENAVFIGCNGTRRIIRSIADGSVVWEKIGPKVRNRGPDSGKCSLLSFSGWAFREDEDHDKQST